MWLNENIAQPIIICGAHGGGTSFMTKLLRMRGFFAGADVCSILERKTHESQAFKHINCGMVHAMKVSGKYQSGRTNEVVREFNRFKTHGSFDMFEEDFRTLFNERVFPLYMGSEDLTRRVWGWKDPRNSLTLGMWKKVLPHARILVIQKTPNPKKESKSNSGRWFDHEATADSLDLFMNPPDLSLFDDVFVCHFENILGYWERYNLLLEWAGLPVIPSASAYEEFKLLAKYEPLAQSEKDLAHSTPKGLTTPGNSFVNA